MRPLTATDQASAVRASLLIRPWSSSPGVKSRLIDALLFELELHCPSGTDIRTLHGSSDLVSLAELEAGKGHRNRHLLLKSTATRQEIRRHCREWLVAAIPELNTAHIILSRSSWQTLSNRIVDLLGAGGSPQFRDALARLLAEKFSKSVESNDLLQQLSNSCLAEERRLSAVCRRLSTSITVLEFPENSRPSLIADLVAGRIEAMHPGNRTSEDRNTGLADGPMSFSGREASFKKRIYRSDKGRLRTDLLLEDLEPLAQRIVDSPAPSMLDIGCGEAGISARLLPGFTRIVCVDSAAGMLERASSHMTAAFKRADRSPVIQFIEADALQMLKDEDEFYDLILAHAVLEWTAKPFDILKLAMARLNPGGALSLAVYNEHGLLFRRVSGGRLDMPLAPRPRHFGGGFTPVYPLKPEEIEAWCADNNYRIELRRGIRCIADYRQPPVAEEGPGTHQLMDSDLIKEIREYEALLTVERKLSGAEPFWRMARYLHFIIKAD